jgi:tetratricopeptide (TPR) repeat protein
MLGLTIALGAGAAVRADGIADGNAGRAALLAGNTDEAIRLFTRAIGEGALNRTNQAVTLNLRGRAYLSKGQFDSALDDLNASLKLADTVDARFNRATLYLGQYRFNDCIDDLTRAIELGAQGADVYAERGHAHVYAGQLDLALQDLNEAIKRQPNYGFAYRTRGHAYLSLHQDDKAIADETRAIALDPKDMEAYWLRAYAYRYRRKAMDKAIADYNHALAVEPTDVANLTSRADAYEQIGRNDLAAADYDALIKSNPGGAFGYLARGRLALAQGRNVAAAADLAKAVGLKPNDAQAVLWLHVARIRAGTDDTAEWQANSAKLDRTAWPGPLLGYVAGKTSAADVLAAAAKGDRLAKTTQTCEALIVLGQDDLGHGRKQAGLDHLQNAQTDCAADSPEARLVKADLQRNGAAPQVLLVSTESKPGPQKRAATPPAPNDPLGLRGSLK